MGLSLRFKASRWGQPAGRDYKQASRRDGSAGPVLSKACLSCKGGAINGMGRYGQADDPHHGRNRQVDAIRQKAFNGTCRMREWRIVSVERQRESSEVPMGQETMRGKPGV